MIFRSPHPDVVIPDVTLTDLVLGGAEREAGQVALVDALSGRRLTYGQLVLAIHRLAAGLSRYGIQKGDVVAVWAANAPEYAVVFHAVARLGAMVTTINPTYGPEELAYQLTDSGARLLVTQGPLLDRAREAIRLGPGSLDSITLDGLGDAPGIDDVSDDDDPPAVAIDPAVDVVAMPYSSGTTGLPKGVMLTHRNLVANLVQVGAVETASLRAIPGFLPFFHIYGLALILNFGLMKRATIVTLPRFDLETVLGIVRDYPVDLLHIVPPIALALAKHPAVDQYDLRRVHACLSAAAPLGPALADAVYARLGARVRQGYGMTEASPATHYSVPGRDRTGTVGPLLPCTEGRIVDPATGADLGVGEAGEVWVRGPQVMKGYLNNPVATAATVDADGWLRTGDIGVMDADGELTIVDRLKELIKVKGFQVAPAELEAVLVKHPAIADAAVIPVPDDEAGEVPKAFVVARETLTCDEVIAFADGHLSHFKRIRHVAFVDQIPKSPSGKILRRVLADQEKAARVPSTS